jgi:hypothetical protein
MMTKAYFFIILFAAVKTYGNDVIDLGTLDIEGEVRRPQLSFTSTNHGMNSALDRILVEEGEKVLKEGRQVEVDQQLIERRAQAKKALDMSLESL